jgi:predicted acylesterase/phospholipase RssA
MSEQNPIAGAEKRAEKYSVENHDAVCFSAGLTGAPFGAGTIHAYLASDRKPPVIAAGISFGALNAAVMERCYRDMHEAIERGQPRSEATRWNWYRRYLSFLLDRPFDVVWDAIPDPSDLIADLPPVKEPNLPVDAAGDTIVIAERLEVASRRKLFIVAKLGSWLAHLPIRFSSVAWITVRYVRARERYPRNIFQLWNLLCLNTVLLWTLWRLLLHTSRPFWVIETWFRFSKKQLHGRLWARPLLGWRLWFIATFLCLVAASFAVWNTLQMVGESWNGQRPHLHHTFGFVVLLLAPILPVWFSVARGWYQSWRPLKLRQEKRKNTWVDRTLRSLLVNLDIEKSLVSDFPLLLKLFRLFEEKGHSPILRNGKFPVLMVAAPLQILPSDSSSAQCDGPNQLWAKPESGLSIVRALRACLGVSPWFAPWPIGAPEPGEPINPDPISAWVKGSTEGQRLDLVDGAAVRHNPLPALFRYLKDHPEVSNLLTDDHRVHLVYDVPIRWRAEPPQLCADPTTEEPRLPNIVETGFDGMRLAHRRDSRLEVLRTNFLTEVEEHLRKLTGKAAFSNVHTIKVNEIAPEEELGLKNELNPTETELLTHIASGCRRTLSVLYRHELQPNTECWQFLRKRAKNRHWEEAAHGVPGLAEICRHCTRVLNPPVPPPIRLLPDSFSAAAGKKLVARFPHLDGEKPRIVFLASGGVFRGSFHIGMLGAMLALDIKPDLIVGASVGTLMGAVLGSIFKAKEAGKQGDEGPVKRLERLADLFIRVDEKVALTRTFKAAAKDLGIRGRSESLKLSPNDLRRMVKRGSREDAGIAATGAPPAMIDAISDLFLIPYRETSNIAADFVAGHFTDALHKFWKQISGETIDRLGIYEAVLGANLIEREIRKLLREDLMPGRDRESAQRAMQPFLECGIAFFATTVNTITEAITTLGAELDCASFDMMEALLASSAFPAAFAPRRASALYPGVGRRDIFYGDGGMFDNLPALPAFEALAEVQKDRMFETVGQGNWRPDLVRRYQNPDLILVGSLNVRQDQELTTNYGSMLKASSRAHSLADNEKIHGLERAALKFDKMLKLVDPAPQPGDRFDPKVDKDKAEAEYCLNGLVSAAVLPIYPSDEHHLNGTFNFCSSLGLDRNRVRRSIAGGCFQTMRELYVRQSEGDTLIKRSLTANRIQKLQLQDREPSPASCPYFRIDALALPCPFDCADGIHSTCASDQTHREQFNDLRKKAAATAPKS